MQAYLIYAGNPENRQKYIQSLLADWKIKTYDILIVRNEEGSMGIADVKDLISRVQHTPQGSPFTVAIVHNAQTMTPEAQNALLKTLEEPPPHTRIILEADKPDAILPTIQSRTHHVRLSGVPGEIPDVDLGILTSPASVSQKLSQSEKIAKDFPDTTAYLDALLQHIHKTLTPDAKPMVPLARHIYKCKQMLKANLKPQTVLDYLFCGF